MLSSVLITAVAETSKMTFAMLVGSTIKIGALTLLAEIAMKAIEQKDYAKVIKFTGISGIAVNVVAWFKYVEENPPLLITLTKQSFDGWAKFINDIKWLFGK